MHGQVDRISSEECQPEMDPAQGVIQHAAGDLGVPVVDRPEHHQDRRHAHDHMEVGDDKVGGRQRDVDRYIAQEQARQAPVDEREDEPDGKQHRNGEMNVTAPQRQHPVVHLDCGRDSDNQRGRGEEESEIRVHAADVHVVSPHDEAQASDGQNCPNHHAIAEYMPARMGAEQVGDDAEGRQGNDIDLRVTEEPEQMLEQQRAAPTVGRGLSHRDDRGQEEAGAQEAVESHHDGADQ